MILEYLLQVRSALFLSPLHPRSAIETANRSPATQQNRPFSHLQIFENLHQAVKKASVVKILDKLVEQGSLCALMHSRAKACSLCCLVTAHSQAS
jgi:hypothetical protein